MTDTPACDHGPMSLQNDIRSIRSRVKHWRDEVSHGRITDSDEQRQNLLIGSLASAAQDRLSGDAASESVWLAPLGSPQIDVAGASSSAELAAAPESGFALVPSNHPGMFRVGVQLGADLLGPLAEASSSTREWLDAQAGENDAS